MPSDAATSDWAEFRARFDGWLHSDRPHLIPLARTAGLAALQWPLPLPLRGVNDLTYLLVVGTLPGRVRQAYGLRWRRPTGRPTPDCARRCGRGARWSLTWWPPARPSTSADPCCAPSTPATGPGSSAHSRATTRPRADARHTPSSTSSPSRLATYMPWSARWMSPCASVPS